MSLNLKKLVWKFFSLISFLISSLVYCSSLIFSALLPRNPRLESDSFLIDGTSLTGAALFQELTF